MSAFGGKADITLIRSCLLGVSGMTPQVGAKRIGLLHELLPRTKRFAFLVNLNNALTRA